ncbi:MAG TPA: hypothetical protein VHE12_05390 [bacterium]|nr:hypothetical protein [bacterium]
MNERSKGPDLGAIPLLSYLAALAVAIDSIGGIWLPSTYARETPSWAAQGMGQDYVDLFFVVPLMLAVTFRAARGGRVALLVLGGLLGYLVYSFTLYAFCVHFNRLFLVYTAALGTSGYGLVLVALRLQKERADIWFDLESPTRFPALYLILTALVFYFLWLSEDLPALVQGTYPKSLDEVGLPSNPVHVLDLGFTLPAMVLAGWALLKKRPFGYFFFPTVMTLCAVMAVAIGGMTVMMAMKGITTDLTITWVFGGMALADLAVLIHFLKRLRS